MALNLGGQSFELQGSKTLVTNENELVVMISRPGVVGAPSSSGTIVGSVDQSLVPATLAPAAVHKAHAAVTASMPDAAKVEGAAQVRANPGDASSLVLDFQGLRTVTELAAPSGVTITNVQAWLGTKFDDQSVAGFPDGGANAVAFQEVQAERLLVTLDRRTVTPQAFATGSSVVLPTPPADLEILVNGVRAWFRPGPINEKQFSDTIDIGTAVSAAADAGGAVTVTFRASAPASLTLDARAEILQRYPVVFPEAAARTTDAPTEGVYQLLLPVQPTTGKTPWQVGQVLLDISAKVPPVRVIPADGPSISGDAELVLDSNHGIVVQLPAAAVSSLGTLTGVRLPVVVGADGSELAGTLRGADAQGEPGDPIPKGALGPVTLQPSPTTDATWIDLALTTSHPLKSSDVLWLEVQASRGSVVWKLATPPADPSDEAPLRRRTSSGKYVALSTLAGVPYSGALRVVGQEKANDPLAAVLVSATGAGASGTVAGVPTQAGTALALVLDPPVPFTPPTSGSADFSLDLTISAPASYAIASAELQYTTQ
jgi:hypothetical protein